MVDETGQPLRGISITVTGPALLGKLAAVTNSEGVFKVPLVPPGQDYELRAEIQGFETIIRKEIIVNLEKTITIDLQMKPATVKEEVEVTAASPIIDVVKSIKSSVIPSDVIFSLPNVRYIGEVIYLAPGTQGNRVYGGGEAEFISLVDGIQAVETDEGRLSLGFYGGIAWDIVEEAELLTSGSSAQFFQAPEDLVNILMKSGSNKFHGVVNFYSTNKHLSDVRISDEEAVALGLMQSPFPIYQVDTGVSLSEPIIKDKIVFMSEFRFQDSKQAGNFIPTVIEGKQYNNYDKIYPNDISYLKLSFLLTKNVRGSVIGRYSREYIPYHRDDPYITGAGNFYFKMPNTVKLCGSFVKIVVKKICRCSRNSLMINKLGKELTYHNEHQKFYPEIFFITRVQDKRDRGGR